MKAVILAGGKGTRLRPHTLVLPKPLIPIGDSPILELLLRRLRKFGFKEIIITIGYLGNLIRSLCGDGNQWGITISYSEENQPMGTIGPLTLIKGELGQTFLVCNGDILTDLDIREFIHFHKKKGGIATIAGIKRGVKIDLGVFECDGDHRIANFMEKPEKEYFAGMGIYLFEPEILNYVPKGISFGFDDLMSALLSEGVPIYSYIHDGCWFDIGIEEDFKKAQREFEEHRERIIA